jgi:curved DNA-binding protein CbpA
VIIASRRDAGLRECAPGSKLKSITLEELSASAAMTFLRDLVEWALTLSFAALEALFTRNWSSKFPEDASSGSGDGSQHRSSKGDETEEAFRTFGLSTKEAENDPAAVREQVKKSWRKLSLIHHPDRNYNSEESNKMTQRLNHHYDLVCQKLDRLEGNHEEEESSVVGEEDKREDRDFHQEQQDKNNQRRSSRKRKNKRNKKRHRREPSPSASDKEDAEMEKKIKKQMQQVKREASRIQEKVRASTQNNYNPSNRGRKKKKRNQNQKVIGQEVDPSVQVLIDESSRDMAHQAWMEATQKAEKATTRARRGEDDPAKEPTEDDLPRSGGSMHDIDDDDSYAEPQTASPPPSFQEDEEEPCQKRVKPKHLLMESCPDSLAVAIRLGNVEAAAVLIHNKTLSVLMKNALLRRRCDVDEDDYENACLEVLTSPLDADGNTPLHYAAHFESSEAVSMIMLVAGDNYPSVVLEENDRGQIPVDFCKVHIDQTFAERMEMLTISARQALRDRQVGVQLAEAAKRLVTLVCQINLLVTMQTLLSFAVGRYVFGRGISLSLCGCLFPANVLRAAESNVPSEAYLFSLNIVWEVFLKSLGLLPCWLVSPSWPFFLGTILGAIVLLVKAASFVRDIMVAGLAFTTFFFNLTLMPFDGLTSLFGLKKAVEKLARRNEVVEGIIFLLIYSFFVLVGQWLWQRFWPAFPTFFQDTDFGVPAVPLGTRDSSSSNTDVLSPMEKATLEKVTLEKAILAFKTFEEEFEEEEF